MTTAEQTLATLNNGVQIPALGFGVFQTAPEDTIAAVTTALEDGYRLIDTAAAYGNEQEVGEAIRQSGIGRSEIFIETRPWISDYGADDADVLKNPVITLEPGELTAIDALDTGLRGGPDPELLNTRTFPKTVDNS